MTDEAARIAAHLWSTARAQEQCALRVPDDALAEEVRRLVRHVARQEGIGIRTARMGDSVVVVRLDARVWTEDAATMRRKLTPPDPDR